MAQVRLEHVRKVYPDGFVAVHDASFEAGDGARARLRLGGRSVLVDRAALQRTWPGRYAAIWRSAAVLSM